MALTFGLLAAPAAAAAPPMIFGVHTPDDPFAGNTLAIDGLEHDTGRRIGIVSWYQNWGGAGSITQVVPQQFNAVIAGGRLPLVTWEPWVPAGGTSQPAFSLARIASGAFDDYIAQWARDLGALPSTIYLRPMHEFNGDWYPWGGTVNGNSPALFKLAWIRMHDIFASEGVRNVRWVFSPVNEDWPRIPANLFEQYYPGAKYVDVLALDGYNWGATKPQFGGWRTFQTTFRSAYRRLSRLGPQPIWIAEVGSATEGGSKAAWVRDMFRTAHEMRRLRAIVWMDTIDAREGDWRIRSPIDVTSAFAPARLPASHPRLRILGRARVGQRLLMRWTTMGAAEDVEHWQIFLNGKRVRTLSSAQARVVRTRLYRVGGYRLVIRGIDAAGRPIVSASRVFHVRR